MTYYNGSSYEFEWEQGRKLQETKTCGVTYTYTYNDEGIRTAKSFDYNNDGIVDVTHYYHLAGSQILSEEWTDTSEVTHLLVYNYDADGTIMGMSYRNSTYDVQRFESYLFIKNIQGDILHIYDENGNKVVSYTYDAWGNITSTTGSLASTVGKMNPFRYRGYYYDEELGFYYLNSRYYDPKIGRFINADGLVSTGQGIIGNNMFAYCENDPINQIDSNGFFGKKISKFFKDLGNAICDGAKRFAKATVGSFQIEGGFGYGLGSSVQVGPIEASASAYQDDVTVGLKNGSTYTAIKGGAGLSAKLTDKISLGLSTEYEHRFETDYVRDLDEHHTWSAPWDVYGCPKTVKDPLQFSFPIIKPVNGNLSEGFFVGVSADVHVIVGGHFTIGWDAKEFWRILTEG